MEKNKMRFNADDAGMSRGVNSGITKLIKKGILYSFSIFTNGQYAKEAIAIAKKNPEIKIGLHFNITTGKSISDYDMLPLLTDSDNNFKCGFIDLCFKVLVHRKAILKEIETELFAQIKYLKQNKLEIDHINSHRHIHVIPGIFNVVSKIAKQNKIPNIRIINEKLLHTLVISEDNSFLWNGNIIKFVILKFFTAINSISCKITTKAYFFSILYTCNIDKELLKDFFIPKGFSYAEIMIHPGNSKTDKKDKLLHYEQKHLFSEKRDIEANL
jgi:predicted glycoside hydrolase/deacetylase ChbG (UPF0249 family)